MDQLTCVGGGTNTGTGDGGGNGKAGRACNKNKGTCKGGIADGAYCDHSDPNADANYCIGGGTCAWDTDCANWACEGGSKHGDDCDKTKGKCQSGKDTGKTCTWTEMKCDGGCDDGKTCAFHGAGAGGVSTGGSINNAGTCKGGADEGKPCDTRNGGTSGSAGGNVDCATPGECIPARKRANGPC